MNYENEKIIEIEAVISNWESVRNQINDWLKKLSMEPKTIVKILIVCEELFVNISNYAYEKTGSVKIILNYDEKKLKISFIDSGKPFNPTEILHEPFNFYDEKKISSNGLLLVKKFTDEQKYKFENNKNIFIVTKFV
jgi:anti-sigma regulatory factor (Ser/Thr protein kinase)